MAVSPSSRSGKEIASLLKLIEFEPETKPEFGVMTFVDDPCRGDCASWCLILCPIWNRLLKLLLPAVEVEFRPLPPLAKGGVGGVSSEFPLPEPIVDDLFRFEVDCVGGEDLVDLSDMIELLRPSTGSCANDIETELETGVASFA
jgi:hypothetical protein